MNMVTKYIAVENEKGLTLTANNGFVHLNIPALLCLWDKFNDFSIQRLLNSSICNPSRWHFHRNRTYQAKINPRANISAGAKCLVIFTKYSYGCLPITTKHILYCQNKSNVCEFIFKPHPNIQEFDANIDMVFDNFFFKTIIPRHLN